MNSELKKIKFNPEHFKEVKKYFAADANEREFLISPVNGSTEEDQEFIADYINEKKKQGIKVYYPRLHTYQDDPIGLTIVNTNKKALKEAGKVTICVSHTSIGSIAYLGEATFFEKEFEIINPGDIKNREPHHFSRLKTIHHPLHVFAYEYLDNSEPGNYENYFMSHLIREFSDAKQFEIKWDNQKADIYELGIMLASEKPIFLKNRNELKQTDKKSFVNVLLKLDDIYRSAT